MSAVSLIQRYQAAYAAANGKVAPPVEYRRGWYVILTPGYPKYRRRNIEQMVTELERRSAELSPETADLSPGLSSNPLTFQGSEPQ